MVKLNYIHLNPVKAGIVAHASDYIYSSASNYVKGDGILKEITLVENELSSKLCSKSQTLRNLLATLHNFAQRELVNSWR